MGINSRGRLRHWQCELNYHPELASGKKLKCYSTTSTTISYVALHILVASNFFPDVGHDG
jgi:hypothetical protein